MEHGCAANPFLLDLPPPPPPPPPPPAAVCTSRFPFQASHLHLRLRAVPPPPPSPHLWGWAFQVAMVNDGPVTIILDSNQRDPVLKPTPGAAAEPLTEN